MASNNVQQWIDAQRAKGYADWEIRAQLSPADQKQYYPGWDESDHPLTSFVKGVGQGVKDQFKGLPAMPIGAHTGELPTDAAGHPQVVDPQASLGQRVMQMLGLGQMGQAYQRSPWEAAGQAATMVPGAVQGGLEAAGVKIPLPGRGGAAGAADMPLSRAAVLKAVKFVRNPASTVLGMGKDALLDWMFPKEAQAPKFPESDPYNPPGSWQPPAGPPRETPQGSPSPSPIRGFDPEGLDDRPDQGPAPTQHFSGGPQGTTQGGINYPTPGQPGAPYAPQQPPFEIDPWARLRGSPNVDPPRQLGRGLGVDPAARETPDVQDVAGGINYPSKTSPTSLSKMSDPFTVKLPADPYATRWQNPLYTSPGGNPAAAGLPSELQDFAVKPARTHGTVGDGDHAGVDTPSPKAAQPPTVQQQLNLERPAGMTDADWEGVQNRVKARAAAADAGVKYFNSKGLTADQLEELAKASPPETQNMYHRSPELLNHAKAMGRKSPLTNSIMQEIIKQMRGGQ